ncbi:MAG TPA: SDR family oxidoreductase [Pseudonocardia sp.]|jgi:NADP-dependent 3-hydroxy acid dehydrogenase YdfG|uniref:SDR family oxidoreductase n=1 Tax=Pseudonocardia sp. TaxID=60912 RepID=UPI002B4AB2B8|nr:SDR family oxidoreductase [Pseudonocardia sp.]HLU56903.1 SDR family oxidoreductase [Pseudonocardia sp.]
MNALRDGLKDTVCLVTGAGSGIGAATAVALAAEGAVTVLVGRRREPLEEVAATIAAAGGTAHVEPASVDDPAQVAALVDGVRERVGPVDVLVNVAGVASKVRNAQWLSDEEWDHVVRVNLTGVFALTRAVLPDMLARGAGTVITVSSVAAIRPGLLSGPAYGAAKAGVVNFMQYLNATYRNEGVRATAILPGEVDTPILDNRPKRPSAQERATMLLPEDVAAAVLLAASLPQRAVVEELLINPTHQRDLSEDLEAGRWAGSPGRATSSTAGRRPVL